MRRLFLIAACFLLAAPALAQDVAGKLAPRPGWRVIETTLSYPELLARLKAAVKAEGMIVVTEAGPTEAAKSRGVEIPGNRVVGVYRNDYAVRNLSASLASGIEAPIRFYVTENGDRTATLSWKTPSAVFAPYMEDGGDKLKALAEELDGVFEKIATRATSS